MSDFPGMTFPNPHFFLALILNTQGLYYVLYYVFATQSWKLVVQISTNLFNTNTYDAR